MQVEGILLTLFHHILNPQENIPKVQLISMKWARQLTRPEVLKVSYQLVVNNNSNNNKTIIIITDNDNNNDDDDDDDARGHIYLVEWKRKYICWHIFPSIHIIELLNPTVIYTNDAQIKFLDAQYVSQRVNVPAQSGAAKRHHLLEISQYYSHFRIRRRKRSFTI